MSVLDIIIFAAVAAFLIMRLWLVLGRRNDDEPQRPNPFATPAHPNHDEEDVMVLPERAKPLPAPGVTAAGHAAASLVGGLEQIKEVDPSFDEKQFLQGAKTAFTGIVKAFAQGDLSRVARLLGPVVYEQFDSAIKGREAAAQKLETRIERVTEAEVTAAKLEGTRATLKVGFVSHQTNVKRDKEGKVIEGDPEKAEEIHDLWTFARDLKSENPNWLLVETQ